MSTVLRDLEGLCAALETEGLAGRLRRQEPLAGYTSYGIGGPADLLLIAESVDEMVRWTQLARSCGVPLLVLGGGTNILVADRGVRGLVILNACAQWSLTDGGLLISESGVKLQSLARESAERAWGGLEWAVGVPGTLGGAIVGNAGAYGGSMSDSVRWVRILLPDGRVEQVDVTAMAYGYRTSALKRVGDRTCRPIVVEAAVQLHREDVELLHERADGYTRKRMEKTPKGRSAGSIFKRTLQYPAGFLIDQAGLKGLTVGGAQVSPLHANFLMNVDGATAEDVRLLIAQVQQKVFQTFGQRLEPEIEFVGEWLDS